MGNLHIVTGYRGESHVSSADIGSFNAAIFGTGQYVLDRGSKFSTITVSNNKIRVSDGDILMQGRHIRLNEGSYVDLTIDNGQADYKRNDLIVARYTKDSSSGVEDANLVVIKGTPAADSPSDPAHTSGDIINNHVFLADMPLYRVPIDGLTVKDLVPLFAMASMEIADGSVTSAKIASNAVTSGKIENGAVTASKLATGAVTPGSIGAIPTSSAGAANGVATLDTAGKVAAAQASAAIIEQTVSYTPDMVDAGKLLTLNSETALTVTIPKSDTVAFPVGTEIEIAQLGTGTVTVAAAEGVTIHSMDGALTLAGQYAVACLKKIAADTWLLGGALE